MCWKEYVSCIFKQEKKNLNRSLEPQELTQKMRDPPARMSPMTRLLDNDRSHTRPWWDTCPLEGEQTRAVTVEKKSQIFLEYPFLIIRHVSHHHSWFTSFMFLVSFPLSSSLVIVISYFLAPSFFSLLSVFTFSFPTQVRFL